MQGNIYDGATKQPIQDVQVLLVLKSKDTIRKNQLEYDSISYNERIALRRQGIKDDYKIHDAKGFSKLKPSQTDTAGHFNIGNILVGCVPKCPTCELIFIKDGYKSFTLKVNSIVQDSIIVSLEKLTDNSINTTTKN
jgi:hypothetical protein